MLCLSILLAHPIFRKPSYELFLRTHQAMAVLLIYSLWRHLPSASIFPRFYLYLSIAMFSFTSFLQCSIILFRNGVFRHRCPRAHITHDSGAVKVRICLQKPLRIEAGQYMSLWIPSVSFSSFLQTHPFTVISWSSKKQDTLDFLIEPRRGITQDFIHHAKNGSGSNLLAIFSGPHGASVDISEYENILMVASGFGIAAHLPYLKKMIHGYNSREIRARRIHLVWQIHDIGNKSTKALSTQAYNIRCWNCSSTTIKQCTRGR